MSGGGPGTACERLSKQSPWTEGNNNWKRRLTSKQIILRAMLFQCKYIKDTMG